MTSTSDIPNILASVLNRRVDISPESIALLATRLTVCRFPKRHLMITAGIMAGRAYFIEQGMTRHYWISEGEEITTSFSIEGGIAFSMDELYYGRPSEEYIETVEPVTAYAIPTTELSDLVSSRLDLARWWSAIHQDEYRRLHRSHKERLTLPAADRYRAFASQFPEVARRARLTDIASYLGINLSTLSRIRASIS